MLRRTFLPLIGVPALIPGQARRPRVVAIINAYFPNSHAEVFMGRLLQGYRLNGKSYSAHCHAGRGQAMSAPWTTRADVEITLRHMAEAGIDRTVLFPINNTEYEKPNQEIAEICGRYPGKFIGFAKHDPQAEAGRIRTLLRREVASLGRSRV